MGREIRRVPPNWMSPKIENDPYGRDMMQPMFDQSFASAAQEWKDEFAKWEAGERPSYCDEENASLEYWEYNSGPPDRAYYRSWKDEEATWYQVWETVSEGTPVTPAFATQEELVDYLATNGDFWDQKRREGPWRREAAENFVNTGFAFSMVAQGGKVMGPKDQDQLA